jgi:hypothetical protein
MAFGIEDLAFPPTGGQIKLALLGIALPGIIAYYGIHVWITEEAVWPVRRGFNMVSHGESAKAIAVVYLSTAAFFHFRWVWGLIQAHRIFYVGTVCSMVVFVGGLIYAIFTA